MTRDRSLSGDREVPRIVASDTRNVTSESDSDAVSTASVASTPLSTRTATPVSTVGELVDSSKLVSIDCHTTVEQAFNLMHEKDLTCIPVVRDGQIYDTFDFADLNGYLLLVLGHLTVIEPVAAEFEQAIKRARMGKPAPVEVAAQFGARDPFVRMTADTPLSAAIQKFGSGVHRIAVVPGVDAPSHVIGMLSQRRLVTYVNSHIRRFPAVEQLYDRSLEELQIGTYGDMVTVQGDAPVIEALELMHDQAVSSVAVVDRDFNLLGNISVVDVSLLTRAWQIGLLHESCKHFLTVVLDSRGIREGGNESVPVFYVHRRTRLYRVVAKLVATRSHRLWITEENQPINPTDITSGRLVGVVSLTDILNFVARVSGSTLDPETARRHRRSSSSSVRSSSRSRVLNQIFIERSPSTERSRHFLS